MSFNLFGPVTKNDIRVGYISAERGFVDDISIPEANEYAKKNPGTTFIFKNRNIIRYLGINDVNNLTENDLISSVDSCTGIELESNCGPPKVFFYGGGGVGVLANPIIGLDGSVLAVDLVYGGNGYQYPPIVDVKDRCGIGAGAVTRSVLGEVVETFEVYDQEGDFENYELSLPEDVGYGRRYDPNGKDVGSWDPNLYANLTKDPINREIQNYQDFLQNLSKPWWDARKKTPLALTSGSKVTRTKFNVTDKTLAECKDAKGNSAFAGLGQIWSDFMNTYAISPVPPSNVPGSDFGEDFFTFEWEEDFPYEGEYVFRGSGDGAIRDLYIDNVKLATLSVYNQPPSVVKKVIAAGVHRIRLDLKNGAQGSKYTTNFEKDIFNTRDYINKADTKLWKTNPVKGRHKDSDFASEFGVLPFDPNSSSAKNQSYAGTHIIRWANVKFPVDGNYTIETWVDDNLTLYIGNRNNNGRIDIGNGLNDIGVGGDEVIIKKNGFTPNGVNTGKSIDTRFFKAGNYRIRAELNQEDFGPLGINNSMSVAINISLAGAGNQLLSQQSWNCNPMGIALTIDAPLPPIPQEPIPQQEGRCPNNPIWSTRFPGSQQKWWPVQYTEVLKSNDITPWSKFLSRYGISPIPPLSLPGTDGGGIVYNNSWQIDIPYDGFYQFAVQRDEFAMIYLDGNLVFDIRTVRDINSKNFKFKPKLKKIFITKGRHTISIELENSRSEIFANIDKKIFRTRDWLVSRPTQIAEEQKVGSLFVKEGNAYYILIGGNDIVEVDFSFDWHDDQNFGYAITKITVPTESNGPVVFSRPLNVNSGSSKAIGTFKANKKYGPIIFEGIAPGSRSPEIVDSGASADQRQQRIIFWDNNASGTISNAQITAINARQLSGARVVASAPISKNGVTYEGPSLFHYQDNRWGSYMNNNSVSPVIPGDSADASGRKQFIWRGVNFPESGQYDIQFLADTNAGLIIGGRRVLSSQGFAENPKVFKVNITQGVYDIVVDSEYPYNSLETSTTNYFKENPTGFALDITKKVSSGTGISKSWVQNPVVISAILIPPPCPKKIRGKGIVTDVIVDDPGNGYLLPQNDLPPEISSTYPVSLRLKDVVVENPGINYNCGVDRIEITPSNGAILDYECDTFGRIVNVKVLNPGLGFTRYPDIRMVTPPGDLDPTGVNAFFRPQFEVVRDPIVVDPEKLIQVTDLVGLKQTGYVDGRAYYGTVFYKEGIRYAGFYETPGDLIQVYTTLQESIDARVITPPSAIQRQGTDVTSNDPRLNIPNTPENLI